MPYIVDGNNLLGSWGGPARGTDGRAEVLRRVAAFCRRRGARATLVFDGRPLREDVPSQALGRVTVRVPPPGRDADSVIREIVEQSRRPADLIVVTSDKALYSYCRTLGASILRAHEWNGLERSDSRASIEPEAEKPEREDDVEGWLSVFGGDE